MQKVYFIRLSNEGDVYVSLDKNMWKSSLRLPDATIFKTKQEAEERIADLSLRSIWPQAVVDRTIGTPK